MYYGTKLPLESPTYYLNLMQSQWKLLSFKSFSDNFDYMLSLRKTEDFPANFLWRKVGRKA